MHNPGFEEFTRLAAQGTLVPVWREFLFDCDTAVTAYAKLTRPPFGFLLESLVGGEKWARYTFLGTRPRAAWRLRSGARVSTWVPDHGWSPDTVVQDPLADLDGRLHAARPVEVPGLPRFIGGAVGYLGYDTIRYIERLPTPPPDDLDIPEALFLFTDVVLAIDNVFGRARAITTVDVSGTAGDTVALRQLYHEATARVDAVIDSLNDTPGPPPLPLQDAATDAPFDSTFSRSAFQAAVARIREYIAAGDAFQVVLSQRLAAPLSASPFELYRALRSLNPSPYLYFLELDGVALVGSSPEVLVRLEDGLVTVRPIAGTRPRGASESEDRALEAELLDDQKERAEHLMLVDLGRNDVGRIARFGTVRVPDYLVIERYSHVMHLVSQVEGQLRPGLGAMDVLRACFPAGTVSGAPKIRAMEIIDELEPTRRGIYAGAVGYLGYGGRTMDTAIAIRTLVARNGRAYVQAGAGIVADSVPAREYAETLSKARALLRVLHAASASAGASRESSTQADTHAQTVKRDRDRELPPAQAVNRNRLG